MRSDDKAYYDLVYEAWRTGINPDRVNMDSFDYYRAKGFGPEEITLKDIYPEKDYDNETGR